MAGGSIPPVGSSKIKGLGNNSLTLFLCRLFFTTPLPLSENKKKRETGALKCGQLPESIKLSNFTLIVDF